MIADNISEYQLQSESGVLDLLSNLPLYRQYVGRDFIEKK